MRLLFPIVIVLALASCEWVRMDPGAAEVRVLPFGPAPTACQRRGEVEVSVQDRVGPYERNTVAVRDELETLARNEALTLHADTIQPLAEPADGKQRWLALRCQGAAH